MPGDLGLIFCAVLMYAQEPDIRRLLQGIANSCQGRILLGISEPVLDPEARRAVVLLISRGMITVPEAAQLAGVSRQLVRAWCNTRKVSLDRARKARITKLWRRALEG